MRGPNIQDDQKGADENSDSVLGYSLKVAKRKRTTHDCVISVDRNGHAFTQ